MPLLLKRLRLMINANAFEDARKVLNFKKKFRLAKFLPVASVINQHLASRKLPPFYTIGAGFNTGYKVDGFGFDIRLHPEFFPGYMTFWVTHLVTGQSYKFGLHPGLATPLGSSSKTTLP